jgi:hypothetical protein
LFAGFRWAQLQLGIFFHPKTTYRNPIEVSKQIHKLRESTALPELNIAYQEIYNLNTNPESTDRQLADKAYKLILNAQRPLSLPEIVAAVKIHPDSTDTGFADESYFLEFTRNFIIADPGHEMNPVQFAHASVQEFLQASSSDVSVKFTDILVYAQAAETCLASLNHDQVWKHVSDSISYLEQIHEFAPYAANYWEDTLSLRVR